MLRFVPPQAPVASASSKEMITVCREAIPSDITTWQSVYDMADQSKKNDAKNDAKNRELKADFKTAKGDLRRAHRQLDQEEAKKYHIRETGVYNLPQKRKYGQYQEETPTKCQVDALFVMAKVIYTDKNTGKKKSRLISAKKLADGIDYDEEDDDNDSE